MRRHTSEGSAEDGMTLVELIVAMGILTVLLSISMAAVVGMTRSTVKAQAVTNASDHLRNTFQQMDKEVRYSSAINTPGEVDGSIYIEYLVDSNAASGVQQCVQWRYNTAAGELQRRTWLVGDSAGSAWRTTVTGLRNDLSDPSQQPFRVTAIGNDGGVVLTKQQLHVYLDAGMGDAGDSRGGQLQVQLVALNSSASSPNTVCMTGGPGRS